MKAKRKRIPGRALAACVAAVALVALAALLAWHPQDADAPAEGGGQPAEVEKGDTEGDGGQDAGDPWSWEPAYVPEGGEPGEVPVMPDNYLPPDDPALWPMPEVEYADDGEGNLIGRGRVIVYFWKSAGVDRAREIVDELGYTWLGGTMWGDPLEDFPVDVMVPEGQEREAKEKLKVLPEVSRVRLYESVPMAVMEDSEETIGEFDVAEERAARGLISASEQQKFHLYAARFVEAWDTVKCEGKVTVAVLDSGKPKKALSDLELNVDYDRAYDAVTGTPQWGTDSVGHGTMVAGVISAIADNGAGTDGASYNAKILPVRVICNDENDDDENDDERMVNSLEYLARAFEYLETLEDIPDVVNVSVGFCEGENGFSDNAQEIVSDISASIERLRQRDVVIVASAGNKDEKLVDGELVLVDHVFYPACLPGVLSVGALSAPSAEDVELILSEGGYPNTSIADFSSVLSDADIVAYGEGIWVLDPLPYDFPGFVLSEQSGTSFAAPQVAAAAALVKVAHPGFSVEQMERALLDSARKPADFVDVEGGGDNGDEADGKDDAGRYGCGALDAAAAVMWSPQASGGGSGGVGPSYTAGGSAWDVFAGAGEG